MIIPYLSTADVGQTINFFTQKLGFSVMMALPDPSQPTFGIIQYGATIQFMVGKLEDLSTVEQVGCGVQFWLYPEDFDLDKFYAEIKAKGVTVVDELQDAYWGDRFFTVTDTNGYRLTFGKVIKQVAPEVIAQEYAIQG